MDTQDSRPSVASAVSEYWTVEDVVARVRCGRKVIYRAVSRGRLRAAKISDRGDLRFKPEWVDAWLEASAQPALERPGGR